MTTETTPAIEPLGEKYLVQRRDDPDGKHDRCRFFVLDPQHDEHARTALAFYADLVRATNSTLADDLTAWVGPSRLDVEEMARVLLSEGAWCGLCDEPDEKCPECWATVTGYAAALRAALIGGAR